MMMLSKAGVSAERVTEIGGVRAALESLREAAAGTVEVAERTETVSGNEPGSTSRGEAIR